MPKVSVIMSTFNDSKYIREAIDSILAQTFIDFEFIIVDDASQDETVDIIREYSDPRIKLIQNEENCGLTVNLNKLLDIASGEYVARMDGDDISYPERFQKQVEYLDEHKDVYLIGTAVHSFGANNLYWRLPDDNEELKVRMLIRPVFAHPTFMFRRELVDKGYTYDESFRTAQDYEFASRVSREFKIGRVQDVLLDYRVHPKQVSNTLGGNQLSNADKIRMRLLKELGVSFSQEQMDVYNQWVAEKCPDYVDVFYKADKLIGEMIKANSVSRIYDERVLDTVLKKMLYTWVIRSKNSGYLARFPKICGWKPGNMGIFIGELIRTAREKKMNKQLAN